MPDHCAACGGPTAGDAQFCTRHLTASRNLEAAYEVWRKAYGGSLSKEDYFSKLEALQETGQAVKEVIEHLRRKGGTK